MEAARRKSRKKGPNRYVHSWHASAHASESFDFEFQVRSAEDCFLLTYPYRLTLSDYWPGGQSTEQNSRCLTRYAHPFRGSFGPSRVQPEACSGYTESHIAFRLGEGIQGLRANG